MRNIKTLLITVFILSLHTAILGQHKLTPADSTLLSSAKNDTTLLRNIAISRNGENIAVKAQFRIAFLLYKAKKENKAYREFLSVYNQHMNTLESRKAAYFMGRIVFQNQKYELAKQYLFDYLKTNPKGKDVERAEYYYARSLYKCEDSAYAETAHKFLSKNHPQFKNQLPLIQCDLVRFLNNSGQFQNALSEANAMLSRFPNDSLSLEVRFMVGDIYSRMKKPTEAIASFSQLQTSGKNQQVKARALFQIGAVYQGQNDFTNARKSFNAVISKYPKGGRWIASSEFSLAMVEYAETASGGDTTLSKSYTKLKQFVEKYPVNTHAPRALRAMAEISIKEKNYSEALKSYNKILAFDTTLIPLNPKSTRRTNDVKGHRELLKGVLLAKAKLLREQMKKPNEAIKIYNEMLAKNPSLPEAKLNKALCLIDLGKKEEAKTIFTGLISENGSQSVAAKYYIEKIR